jgi:hypothetical protein
MMITSDELKVGQTVRCTDLHREGEIVDLDRHLFVALVRFGNEERWCSLDLLQVKRATSDGAPA